MQQTTGEPRLYLERGQAVQRQAAAPLQLLGINIDVHRSGLLGAQAHCSSRCQGLSILSSLDGLRGGFAGSLHKQMSHTFPMHKLCWHSPSCQVHKSWQGIVSSCTAHQWQTCDASVLWVPVVAPGQEALQQHNSDAVTH